MRKGKKDIEIDGTGGAGDCVVQGGAGEAVEGGSQGRGRGRRRKNSHGGGRKPGIYSKLVGRELLEYHRRGTRMCRGLNPESSPAMPEYLASGSALSTVNLDVNPVGRPPLDGVEGALDKEQLKERKRKLGKTYYRKNKLSKIRRAAANLRFYGKVEDDTSDEDEDSEEESGDDEDNTEEMIVHGEK